MSKGEESQKTPEEQADNLKSRQLLSIIDLIGEGEIEGPVGGLKGVFLNDTPIQNEDGSYNFSGVEVSWTKGTQSQAPLKGFPSLENERAVSSKVTKNTPIVQTVTDPNVERLRVTVGVSSLFKVKDDGDIVGTDVRLVVETSTDGVWSPDQIVDISGKTRSEYLRSIELKYLPDTPFQLRVRRVTDDSNTSKLSNDTLWSSFTEIIDSKLSYPNTALVGLKIYADQFSGVPSRKGLIRGRRIKVPENYDPIKRTYTGIWNGRFKIAWSDNPAWIFYDLATCERAGLGRRLGVTGADKWALYQVSQYCDQLVPDGYGGMEPRFTVNVSITEPQQAYEVFSQLASVFRAMPIWDGLQLSVSPDIPTDPVYRYTNANAIDGKFTYQGSPHKSRHTAVYVRWQNPENGWQQSTEYVSDDDALNRYGLNTITIDAWGCTSKGQAHRAGQWLLITEQYERQTISFKTGREGLRHQPGDVIEVADNQFAGANIGGRILGVDGKRVTLDRDIEIQDGQLAWLGYIDAAGAEKTISVFSHPEPHIVVLDDEPVGIDAYNVWTLATSALKPSVWRCVSISEEKDGTFSVTALQHVAEKHQLIENGIKFDPPDNTLYSGEIPPVERLQAEATPDNSQFQIRLTWDTPRSIEGLKFQVKLMRNGAMHKRETVDDTEFVAGSLPMGDYIAHVRGVNGQQQLGPETTTSFTIAAPAVPIDIDVEADNFSITARPVIDGPTSLGTQYEWYFGLTQEAVANRLSPLGRAYILNKQPLKPDTQYWVGVEAVNAVGRSGLLTKPVKTLLKPDDILQIIGPEIPKLDWAKELNQMVEDNSSAVILLGNRAALVVNQDGRVSGMTVTASSQASAIDFMADYVSFTDPETRQRNLYWDNALKTLVLKGQIKLLDGHTVSNLDDIRAQDGKDGNTIFTEFQFSADGLAWHFPDQPGDIYLRSRVVTNGSPGNWGLVTNLKGDRGDKGQDGQNGQDGQDATERFTWFKYADGPDGSGMSDSSDGKFFMGVAYNRTSVTESTNPADYTWIKIKGEDGQAGLPGAGVFRMQTETGVFPSATDIANSLFTSHVGRAPVKDDVLSVYAVDENGYMSQADSKMYDGDGWVTPKMFIDGDLVALGTIRGEHIVAGTELRAPVIKGGEAYFGAGGPYGGYNTRIHSNGLLETANAKVKGHIEATSGSFKGTVYVEHLVGDVADVMMWSIPSFHKYPVAPGTNQYFYTANIGAAKWTRKLIIPNIWVKGVQVTRVYLNGSFVGDMQYIDVSNTDINTQLSVTLPANRTNQIVLYARGTISGASGQTVSVPAQKVACLIIKD